MKWDELIEMGIPFDGKTPEEALGDRLSWARESGEELNFASIDGEWNLFPIEEALAIVKERGIEKFQMTDPPVEGRVRFRYFG